MSGYLTTLPAKLIHKILDNIPSIDILLSVCLVNKRLRSISLTYPRFQLNFNHVNTPINKCQFDSICTQLLNLTSEIVSLTLFDENSVMKSVKNSIFFSRFSIIDATFPNLRSLNLTTISHDVWCSIKTRLPPLIATLSVQLPYSESLSCLSVTSATISDLLFLSPLLKRLSAKLAGFIDGHMKTRSPNSAILSSVQHFHLEWVTVDLYSLLAATPMLHTLEARFVILDLELGRIHPRLLYLQRLRIELWTIIRIQMTLLLSSFPRLNYFAITASYVNSDMANGYVWAQLLQHIEHFEFEFEFSSDAFQQQPFNLDSFRTKFWLEEKKWFVTYDRSFSYEECSMHYWSSSPFMIYPTPERIRTIVSELTASERESYSNLRCLAVDDKFLKCKLLHRHTGTKELYLSEVTVTLPTTLKDLMTGLDMSHITTCTISPKWNSNSPYEHIDLLHNLPRLRKLKLSSTNLSDFFLHQWPHIIDLAIDDEFEHEFRVLSSNDVDAFCRSFTHIERLDILSSFVSDLAQFLNRMKMRLRQICIKQSREINNEQLITCEWIKQKTNLQNFDYTRNRWNTVYLWL